jgi:MYXO-CTERM domain-containing protein
LKCPRFSLALALATGVAASATNARAQDCGKPDLVDTVPSDMATGVPLNATLGAHYTASAEYLGVEEVRLVRWDGGESVLPATWDPTEQLLSATPLAPLEPNRDYVVHWPSLRGINAAAPGMDGSAKFTTGSTNDTSPPSFAGLTGIAWDLERKENDCLDELVERYVFDLDVGPASDDGGTAGLTLMVFQTEGPTVMGEPRPIPARAFPTNGHVQVKLATGDAVGHICFAAIARDTIGRQSEESNSVEVCLDTTSPPFFRGCSVPGPGAGPAAPALLALAALLLRRRTR